MNDYSRPPKAPLLGPVLAETQAANAQLQLEALDWRALSRRVAQWSRLAGSAIEPNAFLEPAFALPAAQHLSSVADPVFLVVSAREPLHGRGEMLALWPVIDPRGGAFVRTWRHAYAACGTPLLERTRAKEAFAFALRRLKTIAPRATGVEIPFLSAFGPAARIVREVCSSEAVESESLDARERPILQSAFLDEPSASAQIAAIRKKLRRQQRRLAALGDIEYAVAREPADVSFAMEQFLALETAGWKGRRGTALLQDPRAATFARAMSRQMAQDGKIEIDRLAIEGKPLAILITLFSARSAFVWKTAYDETYASCSPGALALAEFTQRKFQERGVDLIDSCADSDNQTIHRLWPERGPVVDLFLACSPEGGSFRTALNREEFRRKARRGAKAAFRAARSKLRG